MLNLQSAFCATLVDEFARGGVRHAVLAPGSRSSPLAIALMADTRIELHVRLDERSGAFFALGMALSSGDPVLMVTTSGTAAAEVHAAVIEADLAMVPLIVCTADRPPELQRVGAPQTIDQSHLFGSSVRLFVDGAVPEEANRPFWRSVASRLVLEARASVNGPGPVHCNLPFREPLVGQVGELPFGRADGRPWHAVMRSVGTSEQTLAVFGAALERAERGLFLLGAGGADDDGAALLALSELLGWPVLSDGRACARQPHQSVIAHADGLLRSPSLCAALQPDLVVHLGAPHASRVVATWCAGLHGVEQVLVDPYGRFADPERTNALVIGASPVGLAEQLVQNGLPRRPASTWLDRWRAADDAGEVAIAASLQKYEHLSEPGIARRVVELAPPGTTLFCSSSMPIRDVEWFAPARAGAPVVLANRGANGIDGVVSSVLGVGATARGEGPVVGLIGDLAFLHDISGLIWGSAERVPDALFVLIDNNGGGIFNFLAYPGILDRDRFERGFGTPQAVDIAALVASLGFSVRTVSERDDLDAELVKAFGESGLRVLIVSTEREENVAFHDELNTRIVEAVARLFPEVS